MWEGTIPTDGSKGTITVTDTGSNCKPGNDFLVSRYAFINALKPNQALLFIERGDGEHFSIEVYIDTKCPALKVTDCYDDDCVNPED